MSHVSLHQPDRQIVNTIHLTATSTASYSDDKTTRVVITSMEASVQTVTQAAVSKIAVTPVEVSAVADLMAQFTDCWVQRTSQFNFQSHPFDIKKFTEMLSNQVDKFSRAGVDESHFGYIDKFDLDPLENPRIYIRADLHGDLKSLIENLKTLRKEGLLDDNYKCKSGVHLVFLGDYCDRENYGTQILELLIRLREENPKQIHLIRGNHEDVFINLQFCGTDERLKQLVGRRDSVDSATALQRFYKTLSLTTYFSVNGAANREYVQCTHGLFEPTMDPAPLLDERASGDHLPVPIKRKLSERIEEIGKDHPLANAAERLRDIVAASTDLESDITVYNWGDVQDEESLLCDLGNRNYQLNAQDIQHYLSLSSVNHKVRMIFRGHEHKFQHLMHQDRVLVTTLPVGADSTYRYGPDRAYIITPQTEVGKWRKRAIMRKKGGAACSLSETSELITSRAL